MVESSAYPLKIINEPAVKSMDWHFGKNLIVFGKMDLKDKYYDIFVTMKNLARKFRSTDIG